MSLFDDSMRVPTDPRPGEDLYGLSVSKLNERIAIYREETLRLEADRFKKTGGIRRSSYEFRQETLI